MVVGVRLTPATRARLASLNGDSRESYDSVLNKLLDLVPRGDSEGPYTQAFRIGLMSARLDLLRGRTVEHSLIKRRLGNRKSRSS